MAPVLMAIIIVHGVATEGPAPPLNGAIGDPVGVGAELTTPLPPDDGDDDDDDDDGGVVTIGTPITPAPVPAAALGIMLRGDDPAFVVGGAGTSLLTIAKA